MTLTAILATSLAVIACAIGTIAFSRQAALHSRAAKWNWEQVDLWHTNPNEARRRKANPPDYVTWSRAHRG